VIKDILDVSRIETGQRSWWRGVRPADDGEGLGGTLALEAHTRKA